MPHVDLTKVAEYTAEAAKAGGPGDASLAGHWSTAADQVPLPARNASTSAANSA